MDKNLIEKYKNEMMNMYIGTRPMPPSPPAPIPPPPPAPPVPMPEPAPPPRPTPTPIPPSLQDGTGQLIGIVTSFRGLYPVKGAKVTVFTGNIDDMQIIDTDFTDDSGRTKAFTLSAPAKELSASSGASQKPYASYNMMVESDGYIDNIHLNIPVFSGVVSLQGSDLMLSETAGENKGPQIFDESQEFTL